MYFIYFFYKVDIWNVSYVWATAFITRGQFWAFGYCRCLRLCVLVCINHELIHTITQARITKFGPEVQNTLIKIPIFYLFIYFFFGGGGLTLTFKNQILRYFEVVCARSLQWFMLESPNLDQKCLLLRLRSLLILCLTYEQMLLTKCFETENVLFRVELLPQFN